MKRLFRKNIKALKRSFSVGVDEVGRGCLAGPVTVAAVAVPKNLKFKNLKDSKRLSAKQRKEWFEFIKSQPKVFHARANVYPKMIDRINISQAANLAATRALEKLLAKSQKGLANKVSVYLDGGLFLNAKLLLASGYTLNPRTVVKGDEKYNCIKLASIVAKVSRDKIMRRNHQKYPQYGFDQHVGYGTKVHIQAIKKHGISEIHRFSFLKKILT